MKKWLELFGIGFFSHRLSRESARRGYGNVFLGFIIALALIFGSFVGGEMLPFGLHYNGADDLRATVHAVLANENAEKRIEGKIEKGDLFLKRHGGDYTPALLINTLASAEDKALYSVGGYEAVVDTRPADTLAEFEAYCVSNDGKETRISYGEYLSLSEVARLNFDFRLEYTGGALTLTEGLAEEHRSYLESLGGDAAGRAEELSEKLGAAEITAAEYQRALYEEYFRNYYPDITAYENSSPVPLLRNFYYHNYIKNGLDRYIFIFDDYLTGSFGTARGGEVTFHGFYSELADGAVVGEGLSRQEAEAAADGFIKKAFNSTLALTVYAYLMNIGQTASLIALMLVVAALLCYSLLRLKGVESVPTLGAMLKIVGSYVWFSGLLSAVLTMLLSLFVSRDMISVLPQALFFVTLAARSIVFSVKEKKLYEKILSEKIAQRRLENE